MEVKPKLTFFKPDDIDIPDLVREAWFDALETRLNALPEEEPVVIVAASGGGSRAALFTAMVLEGLREFRGGLSEIRVPIEFPPPRFVPREDFKVDVELPHISQVKGPKVTPADEEVEIEYWSVSKAESNPRNPTSNHIEVVRGLQETAAAPDSVLSLDSANSDESIRDELHHRVPARRANLNDHILMFSSVSGGSLATAYYLSQRYTHFSAVQMAPFKELWHHEARKVSTSPREKWTSTYRGEVFHRMYGIATALLKDERQREYPKDKTADAVFTECRHLVDGDWNTDPNILKIAPWLPTSSFVDDMCLDYMAPLLRGVLDPNLERGESVTRFWEEQFKWENVNNYTLHWQPAGQSRPAPKDGSHKAIPLVTNAAPLALFNACDVEQGSRLILGFPPLPPGLIHDPKPLGSRTLKGPAALTDHGDFYFAISLAEAVRLSANFPWGFEVAHLPLHFDRERVLVLDGGIVDNSGIDSIVHLLRGLRAQEQAFLDIKSREGPTRASSLQKRSANVMNQLRRRGVLLLQIDSGTKDIRSGHSGPLSWLASRVSLVFRPFQALNNASYTNADLSTLDYDVILAKLLEPQAISSPQPTPSWPPLIWRVQLTCNNSENVMTAWSLGPDDKARVLVQFLIEWEHQQPRLKEALERVHATAMAYRGEKLGGEDLPNRLSTLAKDYIEFRNQQTQESVTRKTFYGQTLEK